MSATKAPKKEVKSYNASQLINWSAEDIRSAIDQLVCGDFSRATQLSRSMLLESRYASCMEKRILGLIQSPVIIRPNNEQNPIELEATAYVQKYIDRILPQNVLYNILENYHALSTSPGSIRWETKTKEWYPVLSSLNPEFLSWNTDVNSEEPWRYQSTDGQIEFDPSKDDRMFLMSTWVNGRPSGFISSLGLTAWYPKMMAYRDRQDWNANHANPIMKVITPRGEEDETLRNKYVMDLAMAKGTRYIECPQDEKEKFDIIPVESPQSGYETIINAISNADSEITIRILGANLSTEIVSAGAYAASQTHASVTKELLRADAVILRDTIREQLIRPAIEFNFGPTVEPPWVEWQIAGDELFDKESVDKAEEQEEENIEKGEDRDGNIGANV